MTITTRITTVFVAVAALLTAVGGAAVAAPAAAASPGVIHTVRIIAPDDTVIVCVVTAAPVPQYGTAVPAARSTSARTCPVRRPARWS
jgi:hypothetical protein